MSWLTPLRMERVHGSRMRHLLAPLVFRDAAGREHVVPEGFIYNGPSFPVIWGGDGEASSALHDHAYARPDLYSRGEADALLREALAAEGMNVVRRTWWWLGVRAFGWRYFGDERPLPPQDNPIDHPGA